MERIERLCGWDVRVGGRRQKLLLGEVVHVMVAEGVIGRAAEALEFLFDGGQRGKGFFRCLAPFRFGEVAQFDDEIGFGLAELPDRLVQLGQRIAMITVLCGSRSA
jgi:hypothetical protein